jgi:hypothetical protein
MLSQPVIKVRANNTGMIIRRAPLPPAHTMDLIGQTCDAKRTFQEAVTAIAVGVPITVVFGEH